MLLCSYPDVTAINTTYYIFEFSAKKIFNAFISFFNKSGVAFYSAKLDYIKNVYIYLYGRINFWCYMFNKKQFVY